MNQENMTNVLQQQPYYSKFNNRYTMKQIESVLIKQLKNKYNIDIINKTTEHRRRLF